MTHDPSTINHPNPMSLTKFKPTPFNLTETEIDDLINTLRHMATEAVRSEDFGKQRGLEAAITAIDKARETSFEIRSKARAAKLRNRRAA